MQDLVVFVGGEVLVEEIDGVDLLVVLQHLVVQMHTRGLAGGAELKEFEYKPL